MFRPLAHRITTLVLQKHKGNDHMVVSEAMARAVWPNEDALGKQFRLPGHEMR